MLYDHPLYSLSHVKNIEVQQISQRKSTNLQISHHLREVYRHKLVHGLDFHHHHSAQQQVEPITRFNSMPGIFDRQDNLSLNLYPRAPQIVRETGFVRTFEQPRPQRRMNPHRRRKDLPAYLFLVCSLVQDYLSTMSFVTLCSSFVSLRVDAFQFLSIFSTWRQPASAIGFARLPCSAA
jgi:hypothetical protein